MGRDWRSANAARRPVWVAGSTHEGEEEILLEAHARLRLAQPDALLVLVPRHPNRFDPVAAMLARRGRPWARRSSGRDVPLDADVLLGDTMGELMTFYAAADVAFVAGSLVPVGGHNLLEPASLGVPILTGPHNFNGEDIYRKMRDAGAVREVRDATELADALGELLGDESLRREVGGRGRSVVQANRGALERLLKLLAPLLEPDAEQRRSVASPGV
jgi:3-deoxy-D-manno-octulosonic-acid transferase